jgi:rhodanese-related sulfurtransferase
MYALVSRTLAALLAATLLVGCGSMQPVDDQPESVQQWVVTDPNTVPTITSTEIERERVNGKKVTLIDVRSKQERERYGLVTNAIWVQLGPDRWNGGRDITERQISSFLQQVGKVLLPGEEVYPVCVVGLRSATATKLLTETYRPRNVVGGILGPLQHTSLVELP